MGGRDIRLDIWAKDGTGKHYNVEVQDSYMVFITRTDIFGQGIPVYTINRPFQ